MECPRDKLSACADDELTPVERTVVAGHVAHCPACRRELEDAQTLIGELDRAFERDRLVTRNVQAKLRRRRLRWWRAAAVAAAAVVVAAMIPVLLPGPPRPEPTLSPAAPESAIESTQGGTRTAETVTTAQGQTAQIRLKTGSAVKLFENSRLTVAPLGQTGPVASVSLGYGTARVTAPKAEGARPAFRMSTPAGSVETIGTEFEVALAYEDGKGGHTLDRKTAKHVAKMMMLVTVFSGQVLARHASGGEEVVRPEPGRLVGQVTLPDGMAGFRGALVGAMVSKGASGFVLKAEQIIRVWKESKARDPQGCVGQQLAILTDREKRPADKFLQTLKGLNAGDRVEVEAFHFGGNSLTVVECLRKASNLPAGIWGFRGMLVGTVKSTGDGVFVLKVDKVAKVWRENKARDPKCIVGKEVTVDIHKKSRMAEQHARTLAALKAGDRVEVGSFHFSGDRLSVVELLRKIE